jgi:hypothetical protein
MPGTSVTVLPFWGESQVVPWMSWMLSGPGVPPPPPPSPALAAPGVGVAVLKSVPLLSVSAPLPRCVEVRLSVAGASALPSWITAPHRPGGSHRPVLPPPPYTSLTMTPDDGAAPAGELIAVEAPTKLRAATALRCWL